MRTARTNTRGTRRVTMVALTSTTALAIVGGSVLSANAAGTNYYSCTTTNGSTMLVDASSGGNGLINLGSANGGLLGLSTQNGATVGLLNCTAVVNLGGTAPSTIATLLPIPPGTVPTLPPTVPTGTTPTGTTPTVPTGTVPGGTTPGGTTPGGTTPGGTTPDGTTPGSTTPGGTAPASPSPSPSPSSTTLAELKVGTNATVVYPAKDGYKDKVVFSVKGLNSSANGVKITGKAVLRKGTKVVKTWKITSSTSKLTWNGRIGKKVMPGTYKLTVTAVSPDGMKKVTTQKVMVSSKHLVTRTVAVKSKNIANTTVAVTPAKVVKALKLGKVTVKVRTVADVRGPAKIVFKGKTSKSAVALKDGTHTSKPVTVPKGLKKVTVLHKWKKGDATLTSLRAIFSYKKLV